MSGYLLSLDELCDTLNKRVMDLVVRIKINDNLWLEVTRAKLKAEAHTASAESHATLTELDLKEQTECYNQLLRDVHLAERAKRKDRPETLTELLVREGVPILHLSNPRRELAMMFQPHPQYHPAGPRTRIPVMPLLYLVVRQKARPIPKKDRPWDECPYVPCTRLFE
jgi:hypothetical protein